MPISVREVRNSVIDGVLSTQPELGPKIPDGGYGWVVFMATMFFQMFIPSLIVVYGVLMASAKLYRDIDDEQNLFLWDDKLTYVPLFFTLSWMLFDPTARNLISHSTWPRLIGQSGSCLTCAGLLFVWMGMAGSEGWFNDKICFMLAGIFSGIGSSIQVAQCEILLAQYFKLKHLYLTHLTHIIVALGFMISPMLLGHFLMKYHLLTVILIYEAILMIGIIMNVAFKKPEYLKSKLVHYHYVMENADDEEDIFSKSLTELKVKTKDVLKRIELRNDTIVNKEIASTSSIKKSDDETTENKDWVKFNEEEPNAERKSWERFEEENEHNNNKKNRGDISPDIRKLSLSDLNDDPPPLFNDSRVNMNTTYAFDDDNMENGPKSFPTVFAESEKNSTSNFLIYLKIINMPTFYKSLLTVITTKFSIFLFYALFPGYLYVQISHLRFERSALLVGCLSLGTLVFSGFSYWLNVNKQKRPIVLFFLCWIGANGYFLIATYKHSEYIVLFGALEVVLSIASLQHIGGPLLGLTIRGESNSEYVVLSVLTGMSFFLFLIIDLSYRDCFLMMALLHVVTGLLWVANFFYKKLRILS